MTRWDKIRSRIYSRTNYKTHSSYKIYGKKGIKCLISADELKKLWFRDKAYLLEKPSIDRIDPKGHYQFDNCRFIEQRINNAGDISKKTSKYLGIYFSRKKRYWYCEKMVGGKKLKACTKKSEKDAYRLYVDKFKEKPLLLKRKSNLHPTG